jgi:hypothetical protein
MTTSEIVHEAGGRLMIAFKVQQDAIVPYSAVCADESDDEDKDEDVSRID